MSKKKAITESPPQATPVPSIMAAVRGGAKSDQFEFEGQAKATEAEQAEAEDEAAAVEAVNDEAAAAMEAVAAEMEAAAAAVVERKHSIPSAVRGAVLPAGVVEAAKEPPSEGKPPTEQVDTGTMLVDKKPDPPGLPEAQNDELTQAEAMELDAPLPDGPEPEEEKSPAPPGIPDVEAIIAPPQETLEDRLLDILRRVDRIKRSQLQTELNAAPKDFSDLLFSLHQRKIVNDTAIHGDTVWLRLTEAEAEEYKQKLAVAKNTDYFEALCYIHDHRLYRESHTSWVAFLRLEMHWSESRWERCKRRVRIMRRLAETNIKSPDKLFGPDGKIDFKKAAELNRVDDPDVFAEVLTDFARARDGAPTLKKIVDERLENWKNRKRVLVQLYPDLETSPEEIAKLLKEKAVEINEKIKAEQKAIEAKAKQNEEQAKKDAEKKEEERLRKLGWIRPGETPPASPAAAPAAAPAAPASAPAAAPADATAGGVVAGKDSGEATETGEEEEEEEEEGEEEETAEERKERRAERKKQEEEESGTPMYRILRECLNNSVMVAEWDESWWSKADVRELDRIAGMAVRVGKVLGAILKRVKACKEELEPEEV